MLPVLKIMEQYTFYKKYIKQIKINLWQHLDVTNHAIR